jgi:Mn2+/Fe2+ NRAMP family transporter
METPDQKAQKSRTKGRAEQKKQARPHFRFRRLSPLLRLLAILGPGLIAANAGNDAGGVAASLLFGLGLFGASLLAGAVLPLTTAYVSARLSGSSAAFRAAFGRRLSFTPSLQV